MTVTGRPFSSTGSPQPADATTRRAPASYDGSVLDLGIDVDVWPWIWLVVAVGFALVELTVLGGSFVLLPFAISAFAAMILAFYDIAVEIQWAVFVFGGATLFVVMTQWLRRFVAENELPAGVGADRLVGTTGIVTIDISPDDTDRRGRVSVDGEVWGAITDSAVSIRSGARVRIASMRGTRIVVEPVEPNEQGATSAGEERP